MTTTAPCISVPADELRSRFRLATAGSGNGDQTPPRHLQLVAGGDDGGDNDPQARATEPGRTLHLIDIENLCLGHNQTRDPRRVLGFYLLRSGWRRGDTVLIAGNSTLMTKLLFRMEDLEHRAWVVHGTDAADMKLLEHAEAEQVAEQYDRLVIGSGDHAFSMLARSLRTRSVRVECVARVGSLSRSLMRSCDEAHAQPLTWGDLLRTRHRESDEPVVDRSEIDPPTRPEAA